LLQTKLVTVPISEIRCSKYMYLVTTAWEGCWRDRRGSLRKKFLRKE